MQINRKSRTTDQGCLARDTVDLFIIFQFQLVMIKTKQLIK